MIKLDPGNSIGYLKRGIARTYIDDFLGACTDWKRAEKLGSKKEGILEVNGINSPKAYKIKSNQKINIEEIISQIENKRNT